MLEHADRPGARPAVSLPRGAASQPAKRALALLATIAAPLRRLRTGWDKRTSHDWAHWAGLSDHDLAALPWKQPLTADEVRWQFVVRMHGGRSHR